MRIYIKEVTIIDPFSEWHGQKVNLLIDENSILTINPSGKLSYDIEINAKRLYASQGWLDMRVFSGEPGEEYREDFESLAEVLSAGGFSSALIMPNTKPCIQTKSDIQSLLSKNKNQVSQFLPAGAVTINCEGENLNEMLDLQQAGAIAFTDGSQPQWNSDILVKSLQYLQKFDGTLLTFPQDQNLALFGQMNEGVVSTGLGLKGIPHLAEEIIIQRDLELLQYAGGKIHFSCISSGKSVDLIRDAKAKGLKVSCDVTIHHLILDDTKLESYDPNYKTLPPLRTKKDIEQLIEGVNDGTIDVIVSAHQPYDQDHKKMEFDLAEFGIMGSQLVFPLYQKYLSDKIKLETFIKCVTVNPKKILKVREQKIATGNMADLTLFSLDEPWKFDSSTNYSKSDNSPFLNEEFKAKVIAVFNNTLHYTDSNYTKSI